MFTLKQTRTNTTTTTLTEDEALEVSLAYLHSLVGGYDSSIDKNGDLVREVEDRSGSHSSWNTVKIRKATPADTKIFDAIDVLFKVKRKQP